MSQDLGEIIKAMLRAEVGSVLRNELADVLREILADVHPANDALMSVPNAARYLDVAPKTIHRRIKDGQLKAYGTGALKRVRKRDLLLVLEEEGAEIVDIDSLANKIVEDE